MLINTFKIKQDRPPNPCNTEFKLVRSAVPKGLKVKSLEFKVNGNYWQTISHNHNILI